MKLVIALLVVCAAAGSGRCEESLEDKNNEILLQVCKGTGEPAPFETVGQVSNLIDAFRQNPLACPDDLWDSFTELKKVITQENLMNLCGEKTYQAIEGYHNTFITKDAPKKAPQAIFNFFVVFAQGVTGSCKENLITRYNKEVKNWKTIQASDDAVNTMEYVLQKLAAEFEGNQNFGKVPKHLEDVAIPEKILPYYEKLHLIVKSPDNLVLVAKQSCDVKFATVYEKLFIPVIRMYKLGYKGPSEFALKDEEHKLNKDKAGYRHWLPIIQTCEMLKNVELLLDSTDASGTKDDIGIVGTDRFRELAKTVGPQPEIDPIRYLDEPIWHEAELWAKTPDMVKRAVKDYRKESGNYEKLAPLAEVAPTMRDVAHEQKVKVENKFDRFMDKLSPHSADKINPPQAEPAKPEEEEEVEEKVESLEEIKNKLKHRHEVDQLVDWSEKDANKSEIKNWFGKIFAKQPETRPRLPKPTVRPHRHHNKQSALPEEALV